MSNDPDKVWPTGLNLREAEEVHSYLIDGTRVFGVIALIAHVLVAVTTRGLVEGDSMNNAKLWLVVKPTVGIPLFLSAVAVGSFAVHVAVLSNTSWVSDFLSGKPLGTGAMASAVLPETDTAKVAYIPGGSNEVLITMPDGSTARAVLQMPEDLASLN